MNDIDIAINYLCNLQTTANIRVRIQTNSSIDPIHLLSRLNGRKGTYIYGVFNDNETFVTGQCIDNLHSMHHRTAERYRNWIQAQTKQHMEIPCTSNEYMQWLKQIRFMNLINEIHEVYCTLLGGQKMRFMDVSLSELASSNLDPAQIKDALCFYTQHILILKLSDDVYKHCYAIGDFEWA